MKDLPHDSIKTARRRGARRPRNPESRDTAVFNGRELNLLRTTFARIEAQGEIVGLVFYQKLFTLEPSLRSLFHSSVEVQTRKVMDSLHFTVATLEKPDELLPVLRAMGRRHVLYGVLDHHYNLVILALLQAFEQVLGEAFSPEVHALWNSALRFIADVMMCGDSHRNGPRSA